MKGYPYRAWFWLFAAVFISVLVATTQPADAGGLLDKLKPSWPFKKNKRHDRHEEQQREEQEPQRRSEQEPTQIIPWVPQDPGSSTGEHRAGITGAGDLVISSSGFTARILNDSFESGGGGRFRISVAPSDGGLAASIKVNADQLGSVLGTLSYDPAKWSPAAGSHGDWPGSTEPYQVAVLDRPGQVHFGSVMPRLTGVTGEIELLSVVFEPHAAGDAPAERTIAPGEPLPGDFDGNAVVDLSDLLALAHQADTATPDEAALIAENFLTRGDQSALAGISGESGVLVEEMDLAFMAGPASAEPEPQVAARLPHERKVPGPEGWVGKCYLPLPGLDSQCGVYVDEQAQREADRILDETNAMRAKKSLPALRRDPHLDAVAQAHAIDMANRGYFEHDSPEGMEVFDRLDSVNAPRWWSAGENIAAGYRDGSAAMRSWMDSTGHKMNIRNRDYEYIGIGAYYEPDSEYGWYWVQVFASFDGDPSAHTEWVEPGA